mmetsp:Transcript_31142/g.54742  ORF Transcript_31142/g.54742 Transcript_31142/m.54742 type:complete len:370 (+) Transcript_31142:208-1317(+)|eukprot:CAMPEP_0197530608 /NCGR_PEP_ID=MMETSP1318-20131121/32397_1 /TAXON_ID=552666 /ORGANISM="Partenskyella glossopodia, Strain RCC365" /LENGTH=369 /DNA_ID=CAMNT_0043086509 /DNA_START=141 /DNA_END=1250 /DNA_ORIENTATION=-
MGVCSSDAAGLTAEQKAHEKKLDDMLKNDQHNETLIHKLLLLGAGESGKSTLYKQMTAIYGKGFPEDARKGYTPVIYSNTIEAMQSICRASDTLAERGRQQGDQDLINCGIVDEKTIQSKEVIMKLKPLDDVLTVEIGNHMKIIWADQAIQNTFLHRGKFLLADSADYFFDRLDETCQKGYIPDLQDVFRSRVRTTGILEQNYIHNDSTFHLFDVGGQRNERKKWIHLFERVTAVIFVASLSGYDQLLYEDKDVNRMHESLRLFDEICNLKWFTRTNMILFLNKSDLFEKKLPHTHLSVCFEDYKGENDFESTIIFIRSKFEERNRNPRKQVYAHVTNATDTRNVLVVFNTCQDIIIRKSLEQAGLLMN